MPCGCGSLPGAGFGSPRETYPGIGADGYPGEEGGGGEGVIHRNLWTGGGSGDNLDASPRTNQSSNDRPPGVDRRYRSSGRCPGCLIVVRKKLSTAVDDDRPKIEARRPLDRDRSKACSGPNASSARSAPAGLPFPRDRGAPPLDSSPPCPAAPISALAIDWSEAPILRGGDVVRDASHEPQTRRADQRWGSSRSSSWWVASCGPRSTPASDLVGPHRRPAA